MAEVCHGRSVTLVASCLWRACVTLAPPDPDRASLAAQLLPTLVTYAPWSEHFAEEGPRLVIEQVGVARRPRRERRVEATNGTSLPMPLLETRAHLVGGKAMLARLQTLTAPPRASRR